MGTDNALYRYAVIEIDRADPRKRDEVLWEQGRSGWELIHVLPGSFADPADAARVTLWFKRPAETDIGV